MSRSKKEIRPETISGFYASIPWAVIDSNSFKGATEKAKALLFALMRQHNGKNNGHLHLAKGWLRNQGWTCHGNNSKARDELIQRGLIIQTKRGGLNSGADLFALTWHTISNYVGLDITAQSYNKGIYNLCKLPPTERRPPPKRKITLPDDRASPVTTVGAGMSLAIPTTVTINDTLNTSAVSSTENNVVIPLSILKKGKRIVGVKGKSGIYRINKINNF